MTGLTKSQLTALIDVAKINPDWALQQAFHFGAADIKPAQDNAALIEALRAGQYWSIFVKSKPMSRELHESAKADAAKIKAAIASLNVGQPAQEGS